MSVEKNQIIRLSIQAKLEYLPGAMAFVREIASKMGLGDRDAGRLELVVEEACMNVIEHAFEGEIGSYDILIERRSSPALQLMRLEKRTQIPRGSAVSQETSQASCSPTLCSTGRGTFRRFRERSA
jgi:anti-sigma regulatory factor (Ser/Thr protein kinase)